MIELVDELNTNKELSREKWIKLIHSYKSESGQYATALARRISQRVFGPYIFFRGIIEFTNICKNDCYYCGLRRSAQATSRYRLSHEEVLQACGEGYRLGFRTFVLQGAEDGYFTDDRMCALIEEIKDAFPDVAVTLSIGERSRDSYERLFRAGADRYLLRHESASKDHYRKLHPPGMSFENRMLCLHQLKKIGYQTGCGMMVGSPFQRVGDLADDMLFISDFKPHMLGIGPFRCHHDTPFRENPDGSSQMTLFLLSLCRIMNPYVLLPATTALDCGEDKGRQKAILAGANVIMPNLSPKAVRKGYLLYDKKPGLDQDAVSNLEMLKGQMEEIGYKMIVDRGDYRGDNYGIRQHT